MTRRLIVGCDAALDLRDRAGTSGFDLPTLAALAELAGAGAVRVSVSEEWRPLSEADLRDLSRIARGLEMRMPPIPILVKSALEARPERVLLASEPREGQHAAPLDFQAWGDALPPVIRTLEEAGIEVAVSVTPELATVKQAHTAGARSLEFSTAKLIDLPPKERAEGLMALSDASKLAAKLGISAGVGGGLDVRQIAPVLEQMPSAAWVTVGRAWVGRSLLIGAETATRDLRAILDSPLRAPIR